MTIIITPLNSICLQVTSFFYLIQPLMEGKASVVLIDITQSLNKCSLFNTLVSGSLISVSEKNASIFLKTTINYNKNIFAGKKNVPQRQ